MIKESSLKETMKDGSTATFGFIFVKCGKCQEPLRASWAQHVDGEDLRQVIRLPEHTDSEDNRCEYSNRDVILTADVIPQKSASIEKSPSTDT